VELAGTSTAYSREQTVDQVPHGLIGQTCTRAGEDDLDISFPCAVFKPVVK
jgi:hypothetical protein